MARLRFILFSFLVLLIAHIVRAQQDASSDEDDEDFDGVKDCAFISGQHRESDGVWKYCAMCLPSNCILSTALPMNHTANATNETCTNSHSGTNAYRFYDYCLSSGNDLNKEYCATSTECYQYRHGSNNSITYPWQNLICNPSTCMLTLENGAPPPKPSKLVPEKSPFPDSAQNASPKHSPSSNTYNTSHQHRHDFGFSSHSPTTIALSATCSILAVVAIFWIIRYWCLSRRRSFLLPWSSRWSKDPTIHCPRPLHSFDHSALHSSPPSFQSASPDMCQMNPPYSSAQQWRSSTATVSVHEPLPAYGSPEYSPPKYEQALVTQIRGTDSVSSVGSQTQATMGSSHCETTRASGHGHSLSGEPLWFPIYLNFNPLFHRLRRQAPPPPPPHRTPHTDHPSSDQPNQPVL